MISLGLWVRACDAKALFGAEHANVQPHSGSAGEDGLVSCILEAWGQDADYGSEPRRSFDSRQQGQFLRQVFSRSFITACARTTNGIDDDQLAWPWPGSITPKMITVGASAYPRVIDFARMGEIHARGEGGQLLGRISRTSLAWWRREFTPALSATRISSLPPRTRRFVGPRGGLILCPE